VRQRRGTHLRRNAGGAVIWAIIVILAVITAACLGLSIVIYRNLKRGMPPE
jgi:ABC-type transport system involved in multi-copper enzyme maturation permease subunit